MARPKIFSSRSNNAHIFVARSLQVESMAFKADYFNPILVIKIFFAVFVVLADVNFFIGKKETINSLVNFFRSHRVGERKRINHA